MNKKNGRKGLSRQDAILPIVSGLLPTRLAGAYGLAALFGALACAPSSALELSNAWGQTDLETATIDGVTVNVPDDVFWAVTWAYAWGGSGVTRSASGPTIANAVSTSNGSIFGFDTFASAHATASTVGTFASIATFGGYGYAACGFGATLLASTGAPTAPITGGKAKVRQIFLDPIPSNPTSTDDLGGLEWDPDPDIPGAVRWDYLVEAYDGSAYVPIYESWALLADGSFSTSANISGWDWIETKLPGTDHVFSAELNSASDSYFLSFEVPSSAFFLDSGTGDYRADLRFSNVLQGFSPVPEPAISITFGLFILSGIVALRRRM